MQLQERRLVVKVVLWSHCLIPRFQLWALIILLTLVVVAQELPHQVILLLLLYKVMAGLTRSRINLHIDLSGTLSFWVAQWRLFLMIDSLFCSDLLAWVAVGMMRGVSYRYGLLPLLKWTPDLVMKRYLLSECPKVFIIHPINCRHYSRCVSRWIYEITSAIRSIPSVILWTHLRIIVPIVLIHCYWCTTCPFSYFRSPWTSNDWLACRTLLWN